MRIFGYLSNWIHLLRLTLGICCFTLGAQMDFVTEAMFCKVFRWGDGKPMKTRRWIIWNKKINRFWIQYVNGYSTYLTIFDIYKNKKIADIFRIFFFVFRKMSAILLFFYILPLTRTTRESRAFKFFLPPPALFLITVTDCTRYHITHNLALI